MSAGNEPAFAWTRYAVAGRIIVTDPLLEEKALKFAVRTGNTVFKASKEVFQNEKQSYIRHYERRA